MPECDGSPGANDPEPGADAWFWDAQWQLGEREVDGHVARGEVAVHDGVDALLTHLGAIPAAAVPGHL